VSSKPDLEPKPLAALEPFEEGDFHALSEGLGRDPQYNDRRLVARRKLGTIAQAAVVRIASETEGAVALLQRTSLHQPHAFNHMRVRRLWAYICRAKPEKTRLKRVIGPELAKDLDAAYRNAYLCVGVEADAIEVSLRIHPDGWYDGQNLIRRVKAEGLAGWLERLNALDGYFLRLADWKGEWRCGSLTVSSLEELLRHYTPGDHALAVERRWPVPKDPGPAQGAVFGQDVPQSLVEELPRLAPLYRYTAWSAESDFLFTS
jgi:hypothetical protein